MPDIREEFEDRFSVPDGVEWRTSDYLPIHTENVREYIARCGRASRYASMWSAWQASRAALKVELPEPVDISKITYSRYVLGIKEVKEALQQAGIEVK
ncbi:hypothetical protein ACNFH8_28030 [Pseudomonas sp. NY15436]|uniref:hypothetical protein n=1 Tax=Pseudomonas sp. NY15436 TaxID=3400359 RepID=UPI003A87E041